MANNITENWVSIAKLLDLDTIVNLSRTNMNIHYQITHDQRIWRYLWKVRLGMNSNRKDYNMYVTDKIGRLEVDKLEKMNTTKHTDTLFLREYPQRETAHFLIRFYDEKKNKNKKIKYCDDDRYIKAYIKVMEEFNYRENINVNKVEEYLGLGRVKYSYWTDRIGYELIEQIALEYQKQKSIERFKYFMDRKNKFDKYKKMQEPLNKKREKNKKKQ